MRAGDEGEAEVSSFIRASSVRSYPSFWKHFHNGSPPPSCWRSFSRGSRAGRGQVPRQARDDLHVEDELTGTTHANHGRSDRTLALRPDVLHFRAIWQNCRKRLPRQPTEIVGQRISVTPCDVRNPPASLFAASSAARRSLAATSAGTAIPAMVPLAAMATTRLISAGYAVAARSAAARQSTTAPRPVTPVIAVPGCAAPSSRATVRPVARRTRRFVRTRRPAAMPADRRVTGSAGANSFSRAAPPESRPSSPLNQTVQSLSFSRSRRLPEIGVCAHARWLKQRPDVGTATPAGRANETLL